MKKIIVLACSLIFALSLTACGTNTNKNNNNGNGSTMGSNTNSGSNIVSDVGSAVESTVDGITSDVTQLTAKISADEAKKAALDHAGLKESDVTDLDVDLDRDNGILKYEIDFHANGIEYDYDINADDGTVISADKDRD